MVFSSIEFLFVFLPVVLLLYFNPLTRSRTYRNVILLAASLFFYAWGEPVFVFLMILSIIMTWLVGVKMDAAAPNRKKPWLTLGMGLHVLLLVVFKYLTFLCQQLGLLLHMDTGAIDIALPIGISFFTFQLMSYLFDVYYGKSAVQKNVFWLGLYVSLFPQLIAGPIIKYKDLGDQIDHREYRVDQFASGVQVFVVGLAKKVLLANNLGRLWDVYLATPVSELTVAGAWLGVVAFALQLYFDFSGYSDMAVGLGRMLGFEFLKNFDYPYISRSVTEFWRRWHISLGSWFREYVYIPMGGNRVSRGRLCFNLMVVWGLTGLWHGASWNFLLWGLYFGILLIVEKLWLGRLLERWPVVLRHVYTLFLVLVSWAIFALEDFGQLGAYLSAMFGFAGGGLWDPAFGYYLRSYLVVLVIGCITATPLCTGLWRRIPKRGQAVVLPVLVLAGLLLSTAYLVDATYNPFLYFRF